MSEYCTAGILRTRDRFKVIRIPTRLAIAKVIERQPFRDRAPDHPPCHAVGPLYHGIPDPRTALRDAPIAFTVPRAREDVAVPREPRHGAGAQDRERDDTGEDVGVSLGAPAPVRPRSLTAHLLFAFAHFDFQSVRFLIAQKFS